MGTPSMEEIEREVKEIILATYPEDLFPTPPDVSHLKNNNAAYIMREMAGAIASIVSQTIEEALTEAYERGRKAGIDEAVEVMEAAKSFTVSDENGVWTDDPAIERGYHQALDDTIKALQDNK